AVQRGDDRGRSRGDAIAKRGALSGPAPVSEIAQRGVAPEQRLDLGARPIVARIVDDDHLAERVRRDRRDGLLDQRPDIAGLVIAGDDEGDALWQISEIRASGPKGGPDPRISSKLSIRRTTLYRDPPPPPIPRARLCQQSKPLAPPLRALGT